MRETRAGEVALDCQGRLPLYKRSTALPRQRFCTALLWCFLTFDFLKLAYSSQTKISIFVIKNCRLHAPYCKPEFSASTGLHFANSKKASGDLASILYRKPISLLSYGSSVA
jgi:hypothetical protein